MEFEFGKTKLPHFDTPDGQENTAYFRDKCYEGLHKYYGEHPEQSVIDRLEYELGTIEKMGYVNYYLIVYDFVRYAKSVGIPVGPGQRFRRGKPGGLLHRHHGYRSHTVQPAVRAVPEPGTGQHAGF